MRNAATTPTSDGATEIQDPGRRDDLHLLRQPRRRFLKGTPGVEEAAVNLATEVATIRFLPDVAGREELVRAIESAAGGARRRHRARFPPPVGHSGRMP